MSSMTDTSDRTADAPNVDLDHHDHDHDFFLPMPLSTKIVSVLGITIPFVSLIVAIVLVWGWGFNWIYLALLLGMYLVTALGVTVGYHRLFTHCAFKTGKTVRAILAIMGGMAVEGPVTKWAAMHRVHHKHSDGAHDPHSPHHHGEGIMGVLQGMWHAHVGWIFRGDPKDLARYNPDLRSDRVLRVVDRLWTLWAVLGLVLPAVIGGLITWSWTGVFLGFLWGGLVRVFLVHHVTWSINSVCHIWGSRPFKSHDESRNNVLFGVIGLGEGWHNNHHAFPTSARHGLAWWQIDISYMVIKLLAKLGLAWDVKVPNRERMAAKRAADRAKAEAAAG